MNLSLLAAFVDEIEIGDNTHYVYPEVWTDYAIELLNSVFLYFAIVLAAVFLVVGVFVALKRKDKLQSFLSIAVSLFVGFAATVIVCMVSLNYARIAEKGYAEYEGILYYVLVPTTITVGSAVLGLAASYVASFFNKKAFKIALISAISLFGAALLSLLICLAVYYASGNAEYNNGAIISNTENIVLYVSAVVLIGIIVAIALLFGRNDKNGFDTKAISYGAICLAMSFALSYIKLLEMPFGGSITIASLLPLMLYSYMFGTKKGVLVGVVYGILQTMQDVWFIHPAQFLLDYPIAFATIGLAGMFSKMKSLKKLPQIKFALGAIAVTVLRYISHVISGVFAFSETATIDNIWIYSMAYNSYVFADIAIAVVLGIIVLSSKSFQSQIARINVDKKVQNTEATEVTEAK